MALEVWLAEADRSSDAEAWQPAPTGELVDGRSGDLQKLRNVAGCQQPVVEADGLTVGLLGSAHGRPPLGGSIWTVRAGPRPGVTTTAVPVGRRLSWSGWTR